MSSSSSDNIDLLVSAKDAERAVALLRITVDLFTAVDVHDDDEIRRFGELCINLLSTVPADCRRYVADRLATRTDVPVELIRALSQDMVEIAEPVILHSPLLSAADLKDVAAQGNRFADLVARRADPPAEASPAVAKKAATNRTSKTLPPPAPARQTDETDFFSLSEAERRTRLQSARHESLADQIRSHGGHPDKALPATAAKAGDILLKAAFKQDQAAMIDILARNWRLDIAAARRILDDPGGEPLALTLAAAGIPERTAFSLLLHVNRDIGASTARFAKLAELYPRLSREMANRMVRAWQAGDKSATPAKAAGDTTSTRRRQPREIILKGPSRQQTQADAKPKTG